MVHQEDYNMGGGSRPSAPPPVDVAPARTAAETTAAYKKARRGRSSGLMASTTPDTLGTDTTLGAS